MPHEGDPENEISETLRVDDPHTSIFEKDPDTGKTTIHRKIGGEWRSYYPGKDQEDEADDR